MTPPAPHSGLVDSQAGDSLRSDSTSRHSLGQPGFEFLNRVRRAATNVLSDSPTGREVLELCDDHEQARRMVLEDRSSGLLVVAVVGPTGQGKSWLIRQLVRRSEAAEADHQGLGGLIASRVRR